MNLADLRREYSQADLSEESVLPDPIEQFRKWFEEARNAELLEPNAMVLATVDAAGQPFTRTVLLKDLDSQGLVFYTNFASRKGQQIAGNPRVSLLFPWLHLERQVSINGEASRISTAESLRYFVTRPLGSRLGAWTSPQSQVITSRAILEAKLAQMQEKFSSGEIPLPSFWGGYRVRPTTIEFWQGRRNRLHDRIQYSRVSLDSETWSVHRLAP
jgi:pyridoxamine 5'-phosphate oxidase